MAKKATAKRITQFLDDLKPLREKYGNDAVAKKAKIHPANLSSYVHGSKSPGETTINRFYMNFEDELNQPNDSNESDHSKQSDEPNQPGESKQKKDYPTDSPENEVDEPGIIRHLSPPAPDRTSDFIDFLKATNERQLKDNERLWNDKALLEKDKAELREEKNRFEKRFDALLTNNTTIAESVKIIANKFDPPKA